MSTTRRLVARSFRPAPKPDGGAFTRSGGLRRAGALLLLPLALGACLDTSVPKHERPEVAAKTGWAGQPEGTVVGRASARESIRPDWWTAFGDPYLNQLVQKALDDSIGIQILVARLEVSRASAGVSEADLLPRVAGAAGRSYQVSHDANSGGTTTSTQYSLGAALSWEIDLWGKVQKGVNAQKAEYQASQADYRAGYLMLVSDVATTYFNIRKEDEQVSRQRDAVTTGEKILAIYEAQHREGLVPYTKLIQQRAEVTNLRQELLEIQRRRSTEVNKLATLLGVPAGELRVPEGKLSNSVTLMEVPAGLPSDLLERRPDIIAAEYRLLSQYELVGQAKLSRLPSLTLTGTGGFASAALTSLLSGWSLGLAPAIAFPIFDERLKRSVKVNEAQAKLAEQEYRNTVMRAFEEVENALVDVANRKQQVALVEERLADLRMANQQVHRQLREGLVSQLEVFESERTLLSAEQQLLSLRQQILEGMVTLYKALGGGWPREVVKQATSQDTSSMSLRVRS